MFILIKVKFMAEQRVGHEQPSIMLLENQQHRKEIELVEAMVTRRINEETCSSV